MSDLYQQVQELKKRVAELEERSNTGEREFIEHEFIIENKLYADEIYTKTGGTYTELTT